MTSPINPIGRSRRSREPQNLLSGPTSEPEVPPPTSGTGRSDRVRPPTETPLAEGAAALSAHLLGQKGARRGLKGGAPVLDAAKEAYEATEWSGQADRRKKSGRKARVKT